MDESNVCSSVSQIGIIWETASASEYAVEISNNGKNWTRIGHFTTVRPNWKIHADLVSLPTPICCVPLWRIVCISRATKYGFSIYEIALIKSDVVDDVNNNVRVRKCKRLLKAVKALNGATRKPPLSCKVKHTIMKNKKRSRVTNRPYTVWPESFEAP